MSVSLTGLGIPQSIGSLIQERTLERVFHDALFPRLLYRSEARPEMWPANLGERMVFTRAGLIPVNVASLTPGTDPTPAEYETEQWEVEAAQYGNTIDTHMPTSHVSLASLFLRNTVQLGLNAGQTLNRLPRNKLFQAYLSGDTSIDQVAAAAATSIHVASINGFTEVLVNGRLQAVSAANPLPVSFSIGGEPANTVIGAVPDDPALPLGPGTLTLGTGLTVGGGGGAVRDAVRADTRARKIRVGGAATIDGLTAANIVTLQDIIDAVALLRQNNVPPCSDGYYHVHMDPIAEAEIYQDNQFQRLHQSLPDSAAYRDLSIGMLVGAYWYRNSESPSSTNSGTLVDTSGAGGTDARHGSEIGADVINNSGVPVRRTIVMGGGTIYEKFLDESKYITEAGVTGKIGEFSITNAGVQVMTERIRLSLRSPLDRLQQTVAQTWSWSGDFAIPSDATVGNDARFKRAIVIEHA